MGTAARRPDAHRVRPPPSARARARPLRCARARGAGRDTRRATESDAQPSTDSARPARMAEAAALRPDPPGPARSPTHMRARVTDGSLQNRSPCRLGPARARNRPGVMHTGPARPDSGPVKRRSGPSARPARPAPIRSCAPGGSAPHGRYASPIPARPGPLSRPRSAPPPPPRRPFAATAGRRAQWRGGEGGARAARGPFRPGRASPGPLHCKYSEPTAANSEFFVIIRDSFSERIMPSRPSK